VAYLSNLLTNERLYLFSHHTFGRRSATVDTCINRAEISKLHAVIKWNGVHWEIRDLGRNGTWVNEQRLSSTHNTPLHCGQIINFARLKCNQWKVECLEKPESLLIGLNKYTKTSALSTYHLLPDANEPTAALFACSNRGHWVLEKNALSLPEGDNIETLITHNDIIEIGQHQWQVFINPEHQETLDLPDKQKNIHHVVFQFEVSLDEEHVELKLQYQESFVDLGERTHHYLLLHLSRIRADHITQGLDEKDQGWISNAQLAKELGIDISHHFLVFHVRLAWCNAVEAKFVLTAPLQESSKVLK